MSETMKIDDAELVTLGQMQARIFPSGLYGGSLVEFSNDGREWLPFLVKTDDNPHPAIARATVWRNGVDHPTNVVIGWDESRPPVDEEMQAKWDRDPHALFGARAERIALLRAFRDLLDPEIAAARERAPRAAAPKATTGQVERAWEDEVIAAGSVAELDEIFAEARSARIFAIKGVSKEKRAASVRLEKLIRARRLDMLTAESEAVAAPEDPAVGSVGVALEAALDEARARRVPTPLDVMRGRR